MPPETSDGRRRKRRVLMVVENLSVPLDRRVWQEASTLRDAGFDVTVISPRGSDRDRAAYERLEGIDIHRYPDRRSSGGAISYVREYAHAFLQIRRLARKLARNDPFDVAHAANPPDFLLLAVRSLRRQGTRFVFDHHDVAPEIYESRFGRRGLVHRLLLRLERAAFSTADMVIATNESYRRIAVERGGKHPDDVVVVRNGPRLVSFQRSCPVPELKRGAPHLIAYVGMMGPQDGIDDALRSLAELRRRRDDWRALFAGDGDVVGEMKKLAEELGLADVVEFTGLLDQDRVIDLLSTADVCIAPEPSSPLNDASTMIKVAEYMAMGSPVVAFDLPETRATAQDGALYARPGDHAGMAGVIDALLSDRPLREALGARARRRVEQGLSWERSATALVSAYERLIERDAPQHSARSAPTVSERELV